MYMSAKNFSANSKKQHNNSPLLKIHKKQDIINSNETLL